MFDLPITLTVQNYAVAVDASMNVNSLPAATTTATLI